MKTKIGLVLSLVIVLLVTPYSYAGYFGAPEPLAKDRSVSLGVGYSYLSDKVKFENSQNIFMQKYNFIQNQYYVQLSAAYGNVEGYLRIGAADMRFQELFTTSFPGFTYAGYASDFKDDSQRAFATGGGKYKLEINQYFSIGPNVQFSIFDEYEDKTTGTVNGSQTTQIVKIKGYYRFDAAALLQVNLKPVLLYAGPFLYAVRGRVESTPLAPPLSAGPGLGDKMTESGNFGGIGGLRINLSKGLILELEAQYTERLSAGGLISYSF